MFAEQELQAIYAEKAKSLSDVELRAELTSDLHSLLSINLDAELALQTAMYYAEFGRRHLMDAGIEDRIASMLTKYGPCWGIPAGQCKE